MIRVTEPDRDRHCTDCGATPDVLIDIAGIRFHLCEACSVELARQLERL